MFERLRKKLLVDLMAKTESPEPVLLTSTSSGIDDIGFLLGSVSTISTGYISAPYPDRIEVTAIGDKEPRYITIPSTGSTGVWRSPRRKKESVKQASKVVITPIDNKRTFFLDE